MMRRIPTETIAAKASSVNMSDVGEEGGKTGSHQDSVGLKPPTPLSVAHAQNNGSEVLWEASFFFLK